VPTDKVFTEIVAVPPLSVCVPRTVDPVLKVTVPVGVPDAVDVTVAVNLTDCPNCDGFKADVNAVVVAFSTTCVNVEEALVTK
jgi:hypothetical protein